MAQWVFWPFRGAKAQQIYLSFSQFSSSFLIASLIPQLSFLSLIYTPRLPEKRLSERRFWQSDQHFSEKFIISY
jgi:hypothetical protein